MGFINNRKVLLGSLSLVVGLYGVNVTGAIAQSRIIWRQLSQIASPKIVPLTPSKLLSGFENGEVAVTASNNYRTAYVVARNGVRLNVNSTVDGLSRRGGSFMQVEDEARSLPAIADFPQSQYDASQLIEIVKYAPKYDGVVTRNQARESRRATLSNGKTAYYLQQATNGQGSYRQGWCVFTDESARYSGFTCVNIANSPKAAFTVLNSLSISN